MVKLIARVVLMCTVSVFLLAMLGNSSTRSKNYIPAYIPAGALDLYNEHVVYPCIRSSSLREHNHWFDIHYAGEIRCVDAQVLADKLGIVTEDSYREVIRQSIEKGLIK